MLLVVLLALGGYFYYTRIMPRPAVKPAPKIPVWSVNVELLRQVTIKLPREAKSQTFIMEGEGENITWYFNDTRHSAIDKNRWGGIPVLISQPRPERIIAENATEEKLAEFGLTRPLMEITLTLENKDSLKITIGDKTPDGHAFYAQVPGSNNVATVDITWYQVVERLVKEPPYAQP
ncbi:MAG: hypothetical protein HW402_770 [Dehalococcoidales bacterium]|nr:hypothetical protein [Dehalococcoidales bacterium]